MPPNILSRVLSHYFFITYFIALGFLSSNLQSINIVDLRSELYTGAVFLTYGFIYILPALLFSKLAVKIYGWVPGQRKTLQIFVYFVSVLTSTLTLILIYADHSVYQIFGFHLNGFVWNLITTPGGIDSMGGSQSTSLSYALLVVGCFILQSVLLWLLLHWQKKNASQNTQPKKIYRYLIAIFFVLTLGERVTYGVSSIQGNTPVLSASKAFAFYLPMTFRSWAKKLGIDVKRKANHHIDVLGSQLAYPAAPLQVQKPDKPLNIIWLVAESLRADMLDPEIMPATWAFAKTAHKFNQHYSGANMTRMGMFSMFYGLHGAYWFPFLDAKRSPVLMDTIQQQNYQYEMFTSAVFTYPEFDKTIFANIENTHLHQAPTNKGWKSDRVNVGKLLDFIDKRDPDRPFMTFMFFESPHSRYYFPKESVIRENYIEDLNYATSISKENMPLIKNRYINSVHHLDSQLKRILDYVKTNNLTENTVIIITGDHGEEFMEKGRWGHGSQFSEEQIRVPLILSIPNTGSSNISRMTSHEDIPATILPLLGVSNPPEDYSFGFNLLNGPERKYTVVSDWNSVGYIGPEYKAVLPLKSAGFINNQLTTHDDKPVDDKEKFFTSRQDRIISIMHQLARFTRRNHH